MPRHNQPLVTGPKWLCRVMSWIPFPLKPDEFELLLHVGIAFQAPFRRKQFPWNGAAEHQVDFTAAELHEWVCQQLTALDKPIPHSSWHLVQHTLARITGTSPRFVRRDSFVQGDLHYFEGG